MLTVVRLRMVLGLLVAAAMLVACAQTSAPRAQVVASEALPDAARMNADYPAGPRPDSVSPGTMPRARPPFTASFATRTPSARKKMAFGAFVFGQINGQASQATYAADGSLWVLSNAPSGPDKYLYNYANGTWTNVPGLASRIATAPDGSLYALNSAGLLFHYAAGQWAGLGGQAVDVAVDANNVVYVISKNGAADGPIYRNVNGVWSQIPGAGAKLAGYPDTSLYVIASSGHIYNTPIFGITYTQCVGAASRIVPIAPGAGGGFLALGAPLDTVNGSPIYQFSPAVAGSCAAGTYTQLNGAGIDFAGSATNLAILSANNAIYVASIPTPIATTSPAPVASVGVLAVGWQGNGSFATAGPTVTAIPAPTSPAAESYGGAMNFAAVGQSATVTVTQQGFTGPFSTSTAYFTGTGNVGTCAGNVTVTATSATTFLVTDVGSGFTGCALLFSGKPSPTIPTVYLQVRGPAILTGSAS